MVALVGLGIYANASFNENDSTIYLDNFFISKNSNSHCISSGGIYGSFTNTGQGTITLTTDGTCTFCCPNRSGTYSMNGNTITFFWTSNHTNWKQIGIYSRGVVDRNGRVISAKSITINGYVFK